MKKVALCLFGVVGGDSGKSGAGSSAGILKIGHEHYEKNIIKNNNVDVFVHTWSVDEKNNIEKYYKPKLAIYEKQRVFQTNTSIARVPSQPNRTNNHYSRWYSTKKVVELKQQYEKQNNFEYDFVFISRFDIAFRVPLDFSEFNPDDFYAGNWCRIHDEKDKFIENKNYYNLNLSLENLSHKHFGYPKTGDGLIDFWFFSGTKNMDRFSGLFDKLNLYMEKGKCPRNVEQSICNHRLSLYHLQQIDLVNQLKFKYHLHDDFPLIRRWHYKCGK